MFLTIHSLYSRQIDGPLFDQSGGSSSPRDGRGSRGPHTTTGHTRGSGRLWQDCRGCFDQRVIGASGRVILVNNSGRTIINNSAFCGTISFHGTISQSS